MLQALPRQNFCLARSWQKFYTGGINKMLVTLIIVNRGESGYDTRQISLLVFVLFFGLDCTKHNGCILRTEEVTNRNTFIHVHIVYE